MQPWDRKGYKIPGGAPTSPKLAAVLPAFPANLRKQVKGADFKAPKAIMAAAVEGAQVDFETASRIESRYLVDLIIGQQFKNMTQAFFFDLGSINAGSSRPDGIEPQKFTKVAVIGAGMMGAGIAYVSAKAGMEVVLKDVNLDAAEKGKAYSEKLLAKQLEKGRTTQEKVDEFLGRITPTDDYADLEGCRHRRRGRVRVRRAQALGVRRARADGQAGRAARLQHVDAADHRSGRGRQASGGLHRHPLLQPGRQDAAGRDHRR